MYADDCRDGADSWDGAKFKGHWTFCPVAFFYAPCRCHRGMHKAAIQKIFSHLSSGLFLLLRYCTGETIFGYIYRCRGNPRGCPIVGARHASSRQGVSRDPDCRGEACLARCEKKET